ncbi:MAG TPA: AzlC family ABC transporter permease [Acidimicrobiia bacterium]
MNNGSFRRGFRDSILIFFAVGTFGVAYGVLAIEIGFSAWLAVLSSVVIVSGAAQFAMVGLLGSGAGAFPVLAAATGLGLRHLPMAASLRRLIGPQPLGTRMRLAYVLVDETFGLTLRAADSDIEDLVAYKTAADALLVTGWILGTAVGVWFGASIDPQGIGIGVLFGLLFLGLAAPMIRNRRDWVVVVVTVVVTALAVVLLPSAWQVTGAAMVAALVGVFIDD